jgi:hypothetical protein
MTPDVAVVIPLNNPLGPADDTVTSPLCSTSTSTCWEKNRMLTWENLMLTWDFFQNAISQHVLKKSHVNMEHLFLMVMDCTIQSLSSMTDNGLKYNIKTCIPVCLANDAGH